MNNRICPLEEQLSEYLCGALKNEEKDRMEKHLADCDTCRLLISEAHDVLKKRQSVSEILKNILRWAAKRKWLLSSAVSFLCSFIFRAYFMQFLAAGILTGCKWIIDSKSMKTLIMINGSLNKNTSERSDKTPSRFNPKKD